MAEIFGIAAQKGLGVIDCGATESVASPEGCDVLVGRVRRTMPEAQLIIDIEAGKDMHFKLANGTVTS
eukprot:186669-Lingulodinium_polyedra.AAC.1